MEAGGGRGEVRLVAVSEGKRGQRGGAAGAAPGAV